MNECWINVYEYPKSGRWHSHKIDNRERAIELSFGEYNSNRKTLYRIHVKMDGGYRKAGAVRCKYTMIRGMVEQIHWVEGPRYGQLGKAWMNE